MKMHNQSQCDRRVTVKSVVVVEHKGGAFQRQCHFKGRPTIAAEALVQQVSLDVHYLCPAWKDGTIDVWEELCGVVPVLDGDFDVGIVVCHGI